MRRLALVDAYDIHRLRPHPKNYKNHDHEMIMASIQDPETGQRQQHRTIVVRVDDPENPLAGGMILAGHGVYDAAMELGWPDLAVSVVDCGDDEADELLIRDNRTQERGGQDEGLLAALLQPIAERGRLEVVGYTAGDLAKLLDAVNADPSQLLVSDDGETVTCPDCGARFTPGPESKPSRTASEQWGPAVHESVEA